MSGFKQFEVVLANFKTTFIYAVSGTAILPLVAMFAGLSPSWPPGLTPLTSLLMVVTIAAIFQFNRRKAKSRVNKFIGLSLVTVSIALSLYLLLSSTFIYKIPTNGERVTLGCGWTPDASIVASQLNVDTSNQCPGSYRELLRRAQYTPERIFTTHGINLIRTTLAATWLIFFLAVSSLVAAFVVHQSEATR